MKKLLSALFLLALCSSLAGASVPDPANCSVGPLLGTPPNEQIAFLSPGAINGTTITVTVFNGSIPPTAIQNATVVATFATAPGQVRTCTAAVHTAVTNALGQCQITLRGGGCLTNVLGGCVITANGIEIKNLKHVRSPDNEGHTTSVPSGAVNTQDLGAFGDEFKGVINPPGCHDYDMNGSCNTQDLGYFGDAYKLGTTCTLN